METAHTPEDPVAARRQRDARIALVALLLLGAVRPLWLGWTRLPRAPADHGGEGFVRPGLVAVDIARDPAWRLRLLPGVGRLRAEAILADRARLGPPQRLEDLGRVPGIGPGIVRGLANTPGLCVLLDGKPALPCPHEREPHAP